MELTEMEMLINNAEQREALREYRRLRHQLIATAVRQDATPDSNRVGVPLRDVYGLNSPRST